MTFFFYFKYCTALIRHQRLLGANSWGALDGPLEAREALRVDDLVSRKGLAHSAAFFSVDNLHNLSPFLLRLSKLAGIWYLFELFPLKFD